MDKPKGDNTRLFRQLGENSETAFDKLYELYAARLMLFIGSYLAYEPGPTQEVLSEVMTVVWLQREQLAMKADPERWMYKIAKNQSLAMRKVLIRNRYDELDDHPGLVSDMLTDSQLERDELEGLIWEAVSELTPAEREVFQSKWLEGISSAEIAGRQGVTVQTVNNQMTTARRKVGEYLAKHLDLDNIEGLKKSNQ